MKKEQRKQFLIIILVCTVLMLILIQYAAHTDNYDLQAMISRYFGLFYIALFVIISGITVYLKKRRRK